MTDVKVCEGYRAEERRHTDLSVSRARVGLRLWSSCDLEMRAGWALQQTVVRTAARDIDRYFPLYYVLCTGPGTSGTL